MSGLMPAPCLTPPPPRLRPFGVKYSPTVMSSAPPFGSRVDLLEHALAERARADDLGAVAVLQRAGDDLRRRRRVAVDQHDDRDRRR